MKEGSGPFARQQSPVVVGFLLMNILTSSYTREPRPLPVWAWRARVLPAVRNRPFYTSLWQLTARDRRHAVAFNVGSVK